jgi:hypothetical protein
VSGSLDHGGHLDDPELGPGGFDSQDAAFVIVNVEDPATGRFPIGVETKMKRVMGKKAFSTTLTECVKGRSPMAVRSLPVEELLMNQTTVRSRQLFATLLVASAALVACTGDDSSTPPAPTPDSGTVDSGLKDTGTDGTVGEGGGGDAEADASDASDTGTNSDAGDASETGTTDAGEDAADAALDAPADG